MQHVVLSLLQSLQLLLGALNGLSDSSRAVNLLNGSMESPQGIRHERVVMAWEIIRDIVTNFFRRTFETFLRTAITIFVLAH